MSDLSAADIAEGRRLAEAATPGPWEQDDTEIYRKDAYDHRGRKVWVAAADLASEQSGREDAELIVWARNHLPALLDAAEKVAAVQALHTPDEGHNPECQCGIPAHANQSCTECRAAWPCATIRAINPIKE